MRQQQDGSSNMTPYSFADGLSNLTSNKKNRGENISAGNHLSPSKVNDMLNSKADDDKEILDD